MRVSWSMICFAHPAACIVSRPHQEQCIMLEVLRQGAVWVVPETLWMAGEGRMLN